MRTRSSGWLAWLLWVLTLLGLAATAWMDHLLRLADRPGVTWSQEGGDPYELAAISAATVGAVVASRRPRHPVGWLLLGLGLSLQVEVSSTAMCTTGWSAIRERSRPLAT